MGSDSPDKSFNSNAICMSFGENRISNQDLESCLFGEHFLLLQLNLPDSHSERANRQQMELAGTCAGMSDVSQGVDAFCGT